MGKSVGISRGHHGEGIPTVGGRIRHRLQHPGIPTLARVKITDGPYYYAYWWEEGRRRSRYVGKLDDIEMDSPLRSRRRRPDEGVAEG